MLAHSLTIKTGTDLKLEKHLVMPKEQKQKVRKIFVFPQGDINVPSSRLRIFCYKEMFENADIQFIIFNEESLTKTKLLKTIFHFITADILLVQKQIFTGKKLLLSKLFKKKIVFDLDDAIYVDQRTGIINHDLLNELLKFTNTCKLVIVGNSYLGETLSPYCKKQLQLITLPSDHAKPLPHNVQKCIRIGWIGTRNNLPYLEALKDVFIALQKKHVFEIVVICSERPSSFDDKEYTFIRWNLDVDENLSDYIDIGMMPLPDNKWTKGKCGYKILQYYSFGLPVIASPVGINKELIIDQKTGFLANADREWYDYLAFFLDSPDNVLKMSSKTIEHYSNNYSISEQFQTLLNEINKL